MMQLNQGNSESRAATGRQFLTPAQKFVTILQPLTPLEQSSAHRTDWVPHRNSGKVASFRRTPRSFGPNGSTNINARPMTKADFKNDADSDESATSPGRNLPAVAILIPGVRLANYESSDETLGPLQGNTIEAGPIDNASTRLTRLQPVVYSRTSVSAPSRRTGVERQLTLAATQPSAFSIGVGGSFFASPKAPVAHAPATAGTPQFEEEHFHPSLSDYTPHADAQLQASTTVDTGDQQSSLVLTELPAADNTSPRDERPIAALSVNTATDTTAMPRDYAAAAPPLYFSYSAHDPPSSNASANTNANPPIMVANSREEAEVRLSRQAVMEESAAWQFRNRQRDIPKVKQHKGPARTLRPKSASAHSRRYSSATVAIGGAPSRRSLKGPSQAALLEAHAQWLSRSSTEAQADAAPVAAATSPFTSRDVLVDVKQAPTTSSPADIPNPAAAAAVPILATASTSHEKTARLVEQRRLEAIARAAEGAALHEDFMGHQACMARTSGASVAWEQRCRDSQQRQTDSKARARAVTKTQGAPTSGTRIQHHAAAAMSQEQLGALGTKDVSGTSWSNSAVLHQMQTQLSRGAVAISLKNSPHAQRAAKSKAKIWTTGQLTAAATSGALCGAFRESWDDRRDRHRTRSGQPLQLAPGSVITPPQRDQGPANSSVVRTSGQRRPSTMSHTSARATKPLSIPRPHDDDGTFTAEHLNLSAACLPD